jgi:hypothetical protein
MNKLKQSIINCGVFLTCTLAFICNATAETDLDFLKRVKENRETLKSDDAIVYWGGVAAPIGRFLLIRKDSVICAVLFKNFRRGGDEQLGTTFNTGEEHLYAEYDWYFKKDGSGDFGKGNVKQGHGNVAYGPLVGIGRLAFQTTNQRISCGSIRLNWTYPDIVQFFYGSKVVGTGIELAPTPWSSISEVNGNDSDIKWFQTDQNREAAIIPVSELRK